MFWVAMHVVSQRKQWLALSIGLLSACFITNALAQDAADLPLPEAVKPEVYATGIAFAEGPVFDAAGNLYVVNYQTVGTIGRITPDGKGTVFCNLNEIAPKVPGRFTQGNGLKLDPQGRLLVTDMFGCRILRVSQPDPEKPCVVEILADKIEGKRYLAPNDLTFDAAGNIFFTDSGNYGWPDGALYRLNPETREVVRMDSGLEYANGVAISPDLKYLCVAESKGHRVDIYDLAADGHVSNRRVLIDFSEEAKAVVAKGDIYEPDGIAFDTAGRLYVAICSKTQGVLKVVDVPSGKLLRQYDTGGDRSTNCCFRDGYVYVTVASQKAVVRLKLGVEGFDIQKTQPK